MTIHKCLFGICSCILIRIAYKCLISKKCFTLNCVISEPLPLRHVNSQQPNVLDPID